MLLAYNSNWEGGELGIYELVCLGSVMSSIYSSLREIFCIQIIYVGIQQSKIDIVDELILIILYVCFLGLQGLFAVCGRVLIGVLYRFCNAEGRVFHLLSDSGRMDKIFCFFRFDCLPVSILREWFESLNLVRVVRWSMFCISLRYVSNPGAVLRMLYVLSLLVSFFISLKVVW